MGNFEFNEFIDEGEIIEQHQKDNTPKYFQKVKNIPHGFWDNGGFEFETEKSNILNNLNILKAMDVHEYTLYKKWEEVQNYKIFTSKSGQVKAKIWVPYNLNNESVSVKEIENLNPQIIPVQTEDDEKEWLLLRIFCHTMEFSQSPGRFLKFLITDGNENNRKYLGVASVASDVVTIKDRDKYIGWTRDNRIIDGKLVNTAIGSCIMATQPFGYNFLGGKLIACMITTDVIRDTWKRLYDNILVGMTTTSLYGSYSMYNSLKWWHKCGESAGKILIKPDDVYYDIWHHWLQDTCREEYDNIMIPKNRTGPVTGAKMRVLEQIFDHINVKASDYVHGYSRGVYFSDFYNNTKEFLCGKIKEDKLVVKPLILGGITTILDYWKPKAIKRYLTLKKDGRIKSEILYYNKMMDMNYEKAKSEYFADVGR